MLHRCLVYCPQGFLQIRGALSAEELSQARLAADDYATAAAAAKTGKAPLPADFSGNGEANGKGYGHGFAWARPLERLVFHRAVWPTILELTSGRPRLHGGTMLYDDLSRGAQHAHGTHMHGARDDHATRSGADPARGWPSVRCEPRADGTMFCDNFVYARRHTHAPTVVIVMEYVWLLLIVRRVDCTLAIKHRVFPYLDDVLENDGGVFMLPGSHKSQLVRPPSLFGDYGQAQRTAHEAKTLEEQQGANQRLPSNIPAGCIKPSVTAGDFIVLPEATVHGVCPWRATERVRRTLALREPRQPRRHYCLLLSLVTAPLNLDYCRMVLLGMGLQEKGYGDDGRDPEYRVTTGLRARLARPTIELMTLAPASAIKHVSKMDRRTIDRLLAEPVGISQGNMLHRL